MELHSITFSTVLLDQDNFDFIVVLLHRYWKYYGDILEEGPGDIRQIGLPSSLSDPDAAFVWGGNKKTYFFKGNNYWRYNEFNKAVDKNYPKSIIAWGKRKSQDLNWSLLFDFLSVSFSRRIGKHCMSKQNKGHLSYPNLITLNLANCLVKCSAVVACGSSITEGCGVLPSHASHINE